MNETYNTNETYNKNVCFRIKNGHTTFVSDCNDFALLCKYHADDLFLYDSDEDDNPLPDEEWTIRDCDGRVMVRGRDAIESDTGCLDFDGIYNTKYVCNIEDCSKEELQLIVDAYNDNEYIYDKIVDIACDKLGDTHIHSVKAYNSNIDVRTNSNSQLGIIDKEDWEGCTRKEFEDWLRDDMFVLDRDIERLVSAAKEEGWF